MRIRGRRTLNSSTFRNEVAVIGFIVRRLGYMVVTVAAISLMTFVIIHLPPGDFVQTMVSEMSLQGASLDPGAAAALRERYGLDQPMPIQYLKWMQAILLYGDFGYSLEWRRPVVDLLWNRLGLTFLLAFVTLLFVWAVSLPIGIYTAVRRRSVGDYVATFFGIVGLAVPHFLFALVAMYVAFRYFGQNVGGLFSAEFETAPWSWAKVWDMAAHMIIPVVVLGTGGTAALIRILRANLIDELGK